MEGLACAIPGGKRPDQVIENCRAADLPPLMPEAMSAIKNIYDRRIRPLVHQHW